MEEGGVKVLVLQILLHMLQQLQGIRMTSQFHNSFRPDFAI